MLEWDILGWEGADLEDPVQSFNIYGSPSPDGLLSVLWHQTSPLPLPFLMLSFRKKAFLSAPWGAEQCGFPPSSPCVSLPMDSLLFLLLLHPACSFRPSKHTALLFTAFSSFLAFDHMYVWALFWLQTPFSLLTLYMIGIQLIDENISSSI